MSMKKALNFEVPRRTVKSCGYVAETMGNAFSLLFEGQDVSCEMQTVNERVYLTFWGNGIIAKVEMGELPTVPGERSAV